MSALNDRSIERIAVLGLGNIGLLVAELLHSAGLLVTGHDMLRAQADHRFDVLDTDVSDREQLASALSGVDAVVSCLPAHLNIAAVETAHQLGIHYFDLSEDVTTTKRIRELASSSRALMAPYCGLAPGFVSIVAASQAEAFDHCRSIRMRVGALPQHPIGLMGYAFNWSPEGVLNQYLNACELVEEGVRKWVSPLERYETIYVSGTQLEAFTTSGGVGTFCESYVDRVDNIDYKTMRYPGHMEAMKFFLHELLMGERRELAGEILTNAKPPVEDDVVYVHVASEGHVAGQLSRHEYVRAFRPRTIAGKQRTAIAWTTASSLVSVIEMVRDRLLPQRGFLKQEDIPLDGFLATQAAQAFAAD